MTVTVVPSAGYAVIIQGRNVDGEGHAEHVKTTDFVYQALLDRQLQSGDIYYYGLDVAEPPGRGCRGSVLSRTCWSTKSRSR